MNRVNPQPGPAPFLQQTIPGMQVPAKMQKQPVDLRQAIAKAGSIENITPETMREVLDEKQPDFAEYRQQKRQNNPYQAYNDEAQAMSHTFEALNAYYEKLKTDLEQKYGSLENLSPDDEEAQDLVAAGKKLNDLQAQYNSLADKHPVVKQAQRVQYLTQKKKDQGLSAAETKELDNLNQEFAQAELEDVEIKPEWRDKHPVAWTILNAPNIWGIEARKDILQTPVLSSLYKSGEKMAASIPQISESVKQISGNKDYDRLSSFVDDFDETTHETQMLATKGTKASMPAYYKYAEVNGNKVVVDGTGNPTAVLKEDGTMEYDEQKTKSAIDAFKKDPAAHDLKSKVNFNSMVSNGVDILADMAVAIGTGGGNKWLTGLAFGAQTFNDSKKSGIDAGLDYDQASRYAMAMSTAIGAVNMLFPTEAIIGKSLESGKRFLPFIISKGLTKAEAQAIASGTVKMSDIVKKKITQGLVDMAGEQAEEVVFEPLVEKALNEVTNSMTGSRLNTDQFAAQNMKENALMTIIPSLTMGAAGSSARKSIEQQAVFKMAKDPTVYMEVLNEQLNQGLISPEQFQAKSDRANYLNTIASRYQGSVDQETLSDIVNLYDLRYGEQQKSNTGDPVLANKAKKKIAEIDKEIGEIVDGNKLQSQFLEAKDADVLQKFSDQRLTEGKIKLLMAPGLEPNTPANETTETTEEAQTQQDAAGQEVGQQGTVQTPGTEQPVEETWNVGDVVEMSIGPSKTIAEINSVNESGFTNVTYTDGTRGLIQSKQKYISAKTPNAKQEKPESEKPTQAPLQLIEKLETDIDYGFSDFVADLEQTAKNSGNTNILAAIDKYRREQEYDNEVSGRSDMEQAENELLDAVKKEFKPSVQKTPVSTETGTAPESEQTDNLDNDISSLLAAEGLPVKKKTITPTDKTEVKPESKEQLVEALQKTFGYTKEEAEAQATLKDAMMDGMVKLGIYGSKEEAWKNHATVTNKPGKDMDASQGNKGAISWRGGKRFIHALRNPNASTFQHESAHEFLDIIEEAAKAGNAKAQEILDDYAKFAAKQGEAFVKGYDHNNWTHRQELFARAYERYLRDGKAPTPGLQAVFDTFKQWMQDIYKKIVNSEIDIELDDNIRGVFAKMLGADLANEVEKQRTQHDALVTKMRDYNSIPNSHTQKKSAVLAEIKNLAQKLGYSIAGAGKGKISIKNGAGKPIRKLSIKQNQDPITVELFQQFKDALDFFNWSGNAVEPHVDAVRLGISWSDIRRAIKDIEEGKLDSNAIRKVANAINEYSGFESLPFVQGYGTNFERRDMPIREESEEFSDIEAESDIVPEETQPQDNPKDGEDFDLFQSPTKVYHGGTVKHIHSASKDYPLYVAQEKSQAAAYAKENGGKVREFEINKDSIADEYLAKEIMNDLGLKPKHPEYEVDELNLFELIDPRFETSLEEKDIVTVFKEIEKRGYGGIEFLDTNLLTDRQDIHNIVVFNPKLAAAKNLFQSESRKENVTKLKRVFDAIKAKYPKLTDEQIIDYMRQNTDAMDGISLKEISEITGKEMPKPKTKEGETGELSFNRRMAESTEVPAEVGQEIDRVYEVAKNVDTVRDAENLISEYGEKTAAEVVTGQNDVPFRVRVVVAQQLIKMYNEVGDYARAIDMINTLGEMGKNFGQAIQAFSLFTNLNAEGLVMHYQKAIKKYRSQVMNSKVQPHVKKIKKAFEGINNKGVTEATDTPAFNAVVEKVSKGKKPASKMTSQEKEAAKQAALERYKNAKAPLKQSTVKVAERLQDENKTLFQSGEAKRLNEQERSALKDLGKIFYGDNKKAGFKAFEKFVEETTGDKIHEQDLREVWMGARARNVHTAAQALKIRFRDIAKQHLNDQKKAKEDLVEKLIRELDVTEEQATELRDTFQREFDQKVTEAKEKELKSRLDRMDKGNPGRGIDWKKIAADSNLGAMSDSKYQELFAQALGVPDVNPEDMARIDKMAQDAQRMPEGKLRNDAVQAVLDEIEKIKGISKWGIAKSLWYAGILSQFKTHMRNFSFNTIQAFLESTTKSIADAIQYGDFKAFLDNLVQFGKGFAAHSNDAADVFFEGKNSSRPGKYDVTSRDPLELTTFSGVMKYIGADFAKYVGRALRASDELFYGGFKEMEFQSMARKVAASEGLKGKELHERVNELLYNTKAERKEFEEQATEEINDLVNEGLLSFKSDSHRKRAINIRAREIREQMYKEENNAAADAYASYGTFNYDPEGFLGAISNGIQRFLNTNEKTKLLTFIIPFTRVPANIFNQMLNYTPYGYSRAAGLSFSNLYNKWKKTGDVDHKREQEEWAQTLVKASLGTIAMAAVAILHAQHDDEEDPQFAVTGTGPSDKQYRGQLMNTGWKPYTIKIGDTYIDYRNTPFGLGLATVGAYMDAVKYDKLDEKEAGNRLAFAMQKMVSAPMSFSFLMGPAGVINALSEGGNGDPAKSFMTMVSNTLSSPIPGIYKEVYRVFDPTVYQASQIHEYFMRNVPVAPALFMKEKLNVLGEPIKRTGSIWGSMESDDPVWKMIGEKQIKISVPQRKVNGRRLTDDEYYDYIKVSGKLIREYLKENLESFKDMKPDEIQEEVDNFVNNRKYGPRAQARAELEF